MKTLTPDEAGRLHCIGQDEQGRRDIQAERLCGLEIDHQLRI